MKQARRLLPLLLIAALLLSLSPAAAAAGSDGETAVTRLEQTISAWETETDLSDLRVSVSELKAIFDDCYHRPEFFYVDSFSYSYNQNTNLVTRVTIVYDENFTGRHRQAYEQAVQNALSIVKPGMDDLAVALAFHDWLTANVAYDKAVLNGEEVDSTSYTAYGALVLGRAVCQGYALAYQYLLSRCGIPCRYVSSDEMNHGWNLVQIGGRWYHVDVTWDDPTPDRYGRTLHKYFLLSDGAISDADHRHYGWDATETARDSAYESGAFWLDLEQTVFFTDADTLYFLRSEGKGPEQTISLVRRSWSTGREAAAAAVQSYWPVADQANYYWNGCYAALVCFDNRFFFTDSTHIYSYDPADSAFRTEWTLGRDDLWFYGLYARPDDLLIVLGTSPNEEGSVYQHKPEIKYGVQVFRDVNPTDYFYEPVMWAYALGVTTGTGEHFFSPWNLCTRGQVVTFLWRAKGCPAPQSGDNPFADVPEDAYYRDAVLWAVEQGVTNGAGTDAAGRQLFEPDLGCAYSHILTFLWRSVTGRQTSSYGDWYTEPYDWARSQGLTSLTALATGQSVVTDACPRCDVVTFLARAAA